MCWVCLWGCMILVLISRTWILWSLSWSGKFFKARNWVKVRCFCLLWWVCLVLWWKWWSLMKLWVRVWICMICREFLIELIWSFSTRRSKSLRDGSFFKSRVFLRWIRVCGICWWKRCLMVWVLWSVWRWLKVLCCKFIFDFF